jgi:purine-cytosine permease-like protein
MDLPNKNWIIANIIGMVIWILLYVIYDVILKIPQNKSLLVIFMFIYIFISIADFYFYHKSSLEEEKKTIGQQLRDMMGSIGISAVILVIYGAYHLYQRRKAANRIAFIISNMSNK